MQLPVVERTTIRLAETLHAEELYRVFRRTAGCQISEYLADNARELESVSTETAGNGDPPVVRMTVDDEVGIGAVRVEAGAN